MNHQDSNLINRLLGLGVTDFDIKMLDEIPLSNLLVFSRSKSESKVSFRASWALEHILLKNPELLKSITEQLILNYQELQNWSSLRSYTKLITFILSPKSRSLKISSKQLEIIMEKTFGLIEEIDCPIAVKVNCFDILYYLIEKYPWIQKELTLIIQFNLEKQNSPALNSRGKILLKRILNT